MKTPHPPWSTRARGELRRCGPVLSMLLALPLTSALADVGARGEETAAVLGLLEVVELTLAHDSNILLVESQLVSSRGALLAAAGPFDPVLSASLTGSDVETPLDDGSSSDSTTLTGVLGLARQWRGGLTVEPELTLLRTRDAAPARNQATVSFIFRQPLLRGRGRPVVAAAELAAGREVEASRLDLAHTTALRLRSVISQYWTVAAAALDLDILRATEESSRSLLDTTRRLVAADVTPAAELVQLEADLAAKEAARIGGERSLFQARQALGREIGLETPEIGSLGLPGEPFPNIDPQRVPEPGDGGSFVEQALTMRADLRASRERLEAAEILLRAADNAVEPRLDLVLTPSYSGLVEGGDAGDFFSPLLRNVPGLSASFGFDLSWPISNREARGELIQAQAFRRQGALLVDLTARQIGADVPAALDAVRRSALQLERASEAMRLFERAVINEEKKLRAGTSTLIDVISQRDRLTAAQQRQVSAQLAVALALLELRFQTGTLVAADRPAGSVGSEDLTTLPLR